MLINLSNHPSNNWGSGQRNAAAAYGKILDLKFPLIQADDTSEDIDDLVSKKMKEVLRLLSASDDKNHAVMVEGEFVFTYRMVNALKEKQIRALAAVTQRIVKEEKQSDGSIRKISEFRFEGFREY